MELAFREDNYVGLSKQNNKEEMYVLVNFILNTLLQ